MSPSGRLLATNNEGNHVKVWDTFTGKRVLKLRVHEGPGPHATEMVFVMGGHILVTGELGGRMHLWRLATSERLATLECHAGGLRPMLGRSRDGRRLACVVGDETTVWDGSL